jgi:hypothetical protein
VSDFGTTIAAIDCHPDDAGRCADAVLTWMIGEGSAQPAPS